MLISHEYRRDIIEMHRISDTWGSRGHNWCYMAAGIALIDDCATVLDYGCGKGALNRILGRHFRVQDYDPGIQAVSSPPTPADLVVCADVMEHIEPDCVDDVIKDLRRLTQKRLFVVISTILAGKNLPSGRNAHLTVQPAEWWLEKLNAFKFETRRTFDTRDNLLVALLEPFKK